ncbi:MAG: histidine phosphatase family protein [Candidatus Shapirobacteria bacterium]|nr:histidine phosphatase family protein [Candidatus Shapirobacteria bacterium]
MKLYLVRHGNTDSLDNNINQKSETPLNQQGIDQAMALSKRLENEIFDVVISSSYVRAKQTAEIIGKEFEESDLLIERRKPSEIIGKNRSEPDVAEVLRKTDEMCLVDKNWRYSDEETFAELVDRAIKALDFLINKNKEKILVVSHGTFMGFLVGTMLYGKDLSGELYLKLHNFLRINNTGISVFEYTTDKGWRMEGWNDRSHYLE